MSFPPAVSQSVVIMTRLELAEREGAAFRRGVERGKFEARCEIPRPLDNGDSQQGRSIASERDPGSPAAPPARTI